MDLSALLERLERARGGVGVTRRWVGPRPEGEREEVPALVAAQSGYTVGNDAFERIDNQAAALTLSFLGVNVLASPSPNRPRDELVKLARQAFHDLSGHAHFYSNGDWAEAWRKPGINFRKVSGAPYEAGLIGFDAHKAFIFWVEET